MTAAPAGASSAVRTRGGVAALLLVLAGFLGHVWLYRGFLIDDSLIGFRYVQQWVAGNGLVYNVGERVEGYSSLSWLVLLAPFHAAGLDLILVSKALGLALGVLTLLVSWWFSRSFLDGWHPFTPLLLAASGPFVAWTMGGLETHLFGLLLLVGVYAFLREEHRGRGWQSGLLFGALAWTRPEGLLFGGVALGVRIASGHASGRRATRDDVLRFGSWILIAGSQFAWRLGYYGEILPNTVRAKWMGYGLRGFLEGAYYVQSGFGEIGGLFLVALPLLVAIFGRGGACNVVRYLMLNVVAFAGFVVLAGGDWMPMRRLLVPILPLLFLSVQAALLELRRVWNAPWSGVALTALLAGQALLLLSASLEKRLIEGVGREDVLRSGGDAVAYMRDHVAPGDTIAVGPAGRNAYFLPLDVRVVDIVGLTDAHIAHLPPRFPHGLLGQRDGFGKWDVAYVLAQEPRYVQTPFEFDPASGRFETAFFGSELLINDPRFRERYARVEGIGLFERKE